MIKIRYLSDTHNEIDHFLHQRFKYVDQGEDILVLAGDITNGDHYTIFEQIPSHVEVVFVPGNHEYYYHDFDTCNQILKGYEVDYPNVHILLNESITIKGINFFGGTMFSPIDWSEQNLSIAETKYAIGSCISDFKRISKNNSLDKWSVNDHCSEFFKFKYAFETWINNDTIEPKIVVTHFVPTKQCISPKFIGDALNPYFISEMDQYFKSLQNATWIFGHTHQSHNKVVDGVQLLCNPGGYGLENSSNFRADSHFFI